MSRAVRKQLDHTMHFAGLFGAIYFITVCCEHRGVNQLTARLYHLHALIGIDGRDSLSRLVRDYKRITAKIAGVRWQRNFFDPRLRHDESLAEKFAYICQNPVRAGFVRNEKDWPYVLIPDRTNISFW